MHTVKVQNLNTGRLNYLNIEGYLHIKNSGNKLSVDRIIVAFFSLIFICYFKIVLTPTEDSTT